MAWVDPVVALREIGTILQTREDFCRIVNCINSLSHLRVLSSQFIGRQQKGEVQNSSLLHPRGFVSLGGTRCGKGKEKNGRLKSACKLKKGEGRDFWDQTKTHTVWRLPLLTFLPELVMMVHTYGPSHWELKTGRE